MKCLFAWIGKTDIDVASNNRKPGSAPIAHVLIKRKFDKVVLLSDHGTTINNKFVKWLNKSISISVEVHNTRLTSPTNFNEIYEFASKAALKVTRGQGDNVEYVFHLSPGTPAMAAVWIILAKTRFPAELVESSREAGVQTVSFPFEISADYIPDLLRKPDDDLIRLSAALPDEAPEFKDIIHRSLKMRRQIGLARQAAPRSIPILIQGESGTGKELFARAIHNASPFNNTGEFVAVNCGAIPMELVEAELFGHEKGAFTGAAGAKVGYVEKASNGTLFLDEIGDLPLQAQVKLLRVIQEKQVVRMGSTTPKPLEFRLISATNKNLLVEVSKEKFRADLFYRLGVGILNLPPLREREGDMSLLIGKFLIKINIVEGVEFHYKNL